MCQQLLVVHAFVCACWTHGASWAHDERTLDFLRTDCKQAERILSTMDKANPAVNLVEPKTLRSGGANDGSQAPKSKPPESVELRCRAPRPPNENLHPSPHTAHNVPKDQIQHNGAHEFTTCGCV